MPPQVVQCLCELGSRVYAKLREATGGAGAALADAIARVDGMFEEHVLRPVRAAGRWGGLGRAMGYDPGRGSDRAHA